VPDISQDEIKRLEEEKKVLKEALDGLIELLREKKARGKPNPEVQELVENALTALMFGDVTVAEKWLNQAAGKLGIEGEEAADGAAEGADVPGGGVRTATGSGPDETTKSPARTTSPGPDQDNAEGEDASRPMELPPETEIQDLITYFAERIEECVLKGINTEKTLDILVQAQEAFERGDMETAWRAAKTGIKAFELEMACLGEKP